MARGPRVTSMMKNAGVSEAVVMDISGQAHGSGRDAGPVVRGGPVPGITIRNGFFSPALQTNLFLILA